MSLATKTIANHSAKVIKQAEGVEIGRMSALKARVLLSSPDIDAQLEKLATELRRKDAENLARIEKEFKAKRRAR